MNRGQASRAPPPRAARPGRGRAAFAPPPRAARHRGRATRDRSRAQSAATTARRAARGTGAQRMARGSCDRMGHAIALCDHATGCRHPSSPRRAKRHATSNHMRRDAGEPSSRRPRTRRPSPRHCKAAMGAIAHMCRLHRSVPSLGPPTWWAIHRTTRVKRAWLGASPPPPAPRAGSRRPARASTQPGRQST